MAHSNRARSSLEAEPTQPAILVGVAEHRYEYMRSKIETVRSGFREVVRVHRPDVLHAFLLTDERRQLKGARGLPFIEPVE